MKIFFVIFITFAQANLEEKRENILGLINSEINETKRVLKATSGSQPNFYLRLAELYFEAARHVRERETIKYMSLSDEVRRNVDKSFYFKESKKLFQKAQMAAEFLIRKFPFFKDRGEAYFVLAKNSVEFQNQKKAEKYFTLAYNKSSGNRQLQIKAGISIAESLYNNKKFNQAIPYYEKSLIDKTDKWWTKDSYNLAWCYYRVRMANKAINLMREIHRLSKTGNYIDMSAQVEKDLAFFYTIEARKEEAVAFFREQGADIPSKFIEVSKWLVQSGKVLQAEQLLNEALNLSPSRGQQTEIYFNLLEIFEKYGKVEKHLLASKKLLELSQLGKFSSEEIETLIYQAEKVGAIMQKQVAQPSYRKSPAILEKKARIAVEYYEILLKIDPGNNGKWNFYAAETLFGAGNFSQSIPYYIEANKAAKNDKEIIQLSLVGLLSALDKPSVDEASKEKYTILAYRLYLENDSKSLKASKIYQRMFNYYFKKEMLAETEKTLLDFKDNFPREIGLIEAMLGQIIDYYRGKKRFSEVEKWAARIKSGEFQVSSKYTSQVQLTVVSTKLEKVEKAANRQEAVSGYLEIFNNQIATREARVNAAYNISIINFELNKPEETYKWIEKSLEIMDLKSIAKYASSFHAMGKDFVGRRQFDRGLEIYKKILEANCQAKGSINGDILGEVSYILISDKKMEEAFRQIERFKSCVADKTVLNALRADLLLDEQAARWMDYYQADISMSSHLVKSLGKMMLFYQNQGLLDKVQEVKEKIYNIYQRGLKFGHNFSSDAKEIYALLELESLKKEVRRMDSIPLAFPETVFRRNFQEKYNIMTSINKIFTKIISVGSAKANMSAFKHMILANKSIISAINRVEVPGDKDYVQSFKKSMSQFIQSFNQQINQLKLKAKNNLESGEILNKDNFYFINSDVIMDFEPGESGYLMEKGALL